MKFKKKTNIFLNLKFIYGRQLVYKARTSNNRTFFVTTLFKQI